MTLKEEIENGYINLLTFAQEHDLCFESKTEEGFGAMSLSVKEEDSDRYWEVRRKLELQFAEWMSLLRKSMDIIPLSEKKYRIDTRTHYGSGESYTVKVYDNEIFSNH